MQWGGLSLFKDPIHSDLLKVLMLILLSLQAFGNGGSGAAGRSWATLFLFFYIKTSQAQSSYALFRAPAFCSGIFLNVFHMGKHRHLHGFKAFITSSHPDYELYVFLCANLIYCSE